MSAANDDPRVRAIRADAMVGRGSCSVIDECMDGRDLVRALEAAHRRTPRGAVQWARLEHLADLEELLNTEPDDDGHAARRYRETKAAIDTVPIEVKS